jgi:hypothetical protein
MSSLTKSTRTSVGNGGGHLLVRAGPSRAANRASDAMTNSGSRGKAEVGQSSGGNRPRFQVTNDFLNFSAKTARRFKT